MLVRKNKLITSLVLAGALFISAAVPTRAVVQEPVFPGCLAPSGTVIADYQSGIHGIPGRTQEYRGSDKVYQIDEDQVLQCFCPENGNQGIQTFWWKVPGISETDLDFLKRSGWIYIPNGALWGLAAEPYVAKNFDFTCKNGGGGDSTSGGDAGNGGQVLGASTFPQILGYATTGNSLNQILFTFMWLVIALELILLVRKYRPAASH